jgi:hypothetical protein
MTEIGRLSAILRSSGLGVGARGVAAVDAEPGRVKDCAARVEQLGERGFQVQNVVKGKGRRAGEAYVNNLRHRFELCIGSAVPHCQNVNLARQFDNLTELKGGMVYSTPARVMIVSK